MAVSVESWAVPTIGDLVWNDANGNAEFDTGESGFVGVTVNALPDSTCDGVADSATPTASAVSGAGGAYTISLPNTKACYIIEVDTSTLPAPTVAWGQTNSRDPQLAGVRTASGGSTLTAFDFGFQDTALQIIEHTAPNLVLDNSNPLTRGPDVFAIGTQVCNNTGVLMNDVIIRLGDGATAGTFPVTMCDGANCTLPISGDTYAATQYSGNFSLQLVDEVLNGDVSDGTRFLDDIDPNSCVGAYFAVQYDRADASSNPTYGANSDPADDLVYEFTLWAENLGGDTATLSDRTAVRNEIKASANKIGTATTYIDDVAFDGLTPTSFSPGQIFNLRFGKTATQAPLADPVSSVEWGSIGQGFDANNDGQGDYDAWFQPFGNANFNPDKFRLLSTSVDTTFTCGGDSGGFGQTDNTYLRQLDQIDLGGTCAFESVYNYQYIVVGVGSPSTTISPYQEAASGADNEKYNGDFCGDGSSTDPSVCIEFNSSGGPTITKDVDIASITADGDSVLTYTLTYNNNETFPIGDPDNSAVVLDDAIPDHSGGLVTYCDSTDDAVCQIAEPCALINTNYATPGSCDIEWSVDGLPKLDVNKVWSSAKPADPTTITDVRWVLHDPVAAMGTGQVQFQVFVQGVDPNKYVGTLVNTAEIRINGGETLDMDDAETCIRDPIDCPPPTSVTIGNVSIEVASVDDFLGSIGVDGMDTSELLDFLKNWDEDRAAELEGAGHIAIRNAIINIIDPNGDGLMAMLAWDTLEERGTIGFYVERQNTDGSWSRVSGKMLPGLITAPLGGEYMLIDPAAVSGNTYQYQIIEQEATGSARTYGPYSVEMQ